MKMAHILVIPYPAPGHMLPILDLSNQLAIRGLTLTIMVTPKNLPLLQPLLSLHPSMETLVLPFPSHPDIPAGVENMQEFPISFIPTILSALDTLHDPILQWFQSHTSPPTAMITDSFFSRWTHPMACGLGIKNVAFSPLNAQGTLGLWNALEKGVLKGYEDFVVENRAVDKVCWGIIFNSFTEMEEELLDHIKKKVLGHDRAWALGPFLPIGNDPLTASKKCGRSSLPESDIFAWLDSCHVDKSVVYIGFGSQITLTRQQMNAIADALEGSGVRFIWSVKDPMKGVNNMDEYGVIPDGFEERMAGRGLVIKGWAPQQAILQHRAVGSYLTHCGCNSAIEGLRAGVLLLAWPMQADHFENTKLLVDQLGVALRVCEGLKTVPDSVNLAKILAESVSIGAQHERTTRAMELGKLALNASKPGGSSHKALDELVKNLSN